MIEVIETTEIKEDGIDYVVETLSNGAVIKTIKPPEELIITTPDPQEEEAMLLSQPPTKADLMALNSDPNNSLDAYLRSVLVTNSLPLFAQGEVDFSDFIGFLQNAGSITSDVFMDPESGYWMVFESEGFKALGEALTNNVPPKYLENRNYWPIFRTKGFAEFREVMVDNLTLEEFNAADLLTVYRGLTYDVFKAVVEAHIAPSALVSPVDYALEFKTNTSMQLLARVLLKGLDPADIARPTGDALTLLNATDMETLAEILLRDIDPSDVIHPTGDNATLKEKAGIGILCEFLINDSFSVADALDPVNHFTKVSARSHTAVSSLSDSSWTELIRIDGAGIFFGAYNHTWLNYTEANATVRYQMLFDGEVVDDFTIPRNRYDQVNVWGNPENSSSSGKVYIPQEQQYSYARNASPSSSTTLTNNQSLCNMGYCRPFKQNFVLRARRSGTASTSDSIYTFDVGVMMS